LKKGDKVSVYTKSSKWKTDPWTGTVVKVRPTIVDLRGRKTINAALVEEGGQLLFHVGGKKHGIPGVGGHRDLEVAKIEKAAAETVRKISGEIAAAKTAAGIDALAKRIADVKDDSLTKQAADRKSEIDKSDETKQAADKAEAEKSFRAKLPKGLQKAFDDMDEKEREAFMGKFGKSDAGDPVTKTLTDLAKAKDDLTAKVEKLEAAAHLRKLADELKDLNGAVTKIDEFAGAYAKLEKADKDAAEALLKDFRALAKQAKDGGLFKVIGRDGAGDDSASGRLEKAVKKYMSEHSGANEATATDAVLKVEPKLYEDYISEKEAK